MWVCPYCGWLNGKTQLSCYNCGESIAALRDEDALRANECHLQPISRVLGIDFETANRYRDSACSVGLFLKDIQSGHVYYDREILINPKQEFDYFNVKVHGITPDKVANASDFEYAYEIISHLMSDDTLVIAHNASFDISVLRHECERYSCSLPVADFVCTMKFARAVIENVPSYSLDALSQHLSLGDFRHHSALDDARQSVALFEYLLSEVNCSSLDDLHKNGIVSAGHLGRFDDEYETCRALRTVKRSPATISSDSSSQMVSSTMDRADIDEDHFLFGKTVVFTGALDSMTREEATDAVSRCGGIPGKGITKETNYLVFGYCDSYLLKGNEKSSKLMKAERYISKGYDLQIIDESEFVRLLTDGGAE